MKKHIKRVGKKTAKFIESKTFKPLIAALILAVIISLLINSNAEVPDNKAKYEITEVDIFSLDDFNANDVSVIGLKVGERTQDVLNTLGTPDIKTDFKGGTANFEYSKAIGISETGLIISVSNGIVTSITIKEPFQKNLIGETKVNLEKDDVYRIFGVPDKTTFMPLKENSANIIRIISYETMGLDFTVDKNQVIGFSLLLNDGTKSDFDHSTTVYSLPIIETN